MLKVGASSDCANRIEASSRMKNVLMTNIIVGTAGHIDHGKTALVRALTGVDTDRLEEEKRRGISIDIGFASLSLTPDLRIGFVDVPGHERFVKNMLAGVGGIDLVLFVIAADESIKPQTREHFDICRLLGIPKGIVALTKADLADTDMLELVRLETEEFVAGSFLDGAPIVAVSSTTGAGIDELRRHLTAMASSIAAKDSNRHFRLPVDRSFSLKGFGTVVTGTLIAGSVGVEEEVEVHPLGRLLRVRGIHVHGDPVARAMAGQRTALNLAAIEASELQRGMVLSAPGLFEPARRIDCEFDLLPSAKPLKHRAPVHFHAGTAEVVAEARLLEDRAAVEPGSRALVRFILKEPLLLLPGDRFIVRMFSPVVTIGGGRVLEIAPPARMRRADLIARTRALAAGDPPERVALLVREAKYGLSIDAVLARTGLLKDEILAAARTARVTLLAAPQPWLIDRDAFAAMQKRLVETLRNFHRSQPLAPGMPREELRGRVLPAAQPFLLDALLAQTSEAAAEGELLRLASHKVAFREDEEQALGKIEAAFRDAGLAVPAVDQVLAGSGVEAARAKSLLQILLRSRKLVRVSADLVFHHTAIESLRAQLARRKGERFAVPQFKDWTGISRKYAIPLLEFLDRERVTRREGDTRLVL